MDMATSLLAMDGKRKLMQGNYKSFLLAILEIFENFFLGLIELSN